MINVIIHGYLGKMGQTLKRLIDQRDDMQIVCGIDIGLAGKEDLTGESGTVLCSKPEQFKGEADAIIDFSNHAAVKEILYYAKEWQIPCIVATTGLTEDELAFLNETSENVAVFRSANMSLGINLMAKALQLMTPFVEKDFDMEIVERCTERHRTATCGQDQRSLRGKEGVHLRQRGRQSRVRQKADGHPRAARRYGRG